MKQLLFFALFTTPFLSVSQNQLRTEFGVYKQSYKMNTLNSFIVAQYFPDPDLIDSNITSTIQSGLKYEFSTTLRPLKFQDVGVVFSYSRGETFHQRLYLYQGNNPYLDTVNFQNGYKVSSYQLGIKGTTYLNGILNWDAKTSVLNRIVIGVDYSFGVQFSGLKVIDKVEQLNNLVTNYYEIRRMQSTNVSGTVGLNIGFELFKGKYLSAIGFRGGYQFAQTGEIRNTAGGTYPTNNSPIRLDFSGLYLGGYLNFGKR